MSYTAVNYREADPVAGSVHLPGAPLECEQLGVTVVECPPEWSGKAHDHADRGHEEVYLLVEGEATAIVEDEAVDLTAGDAIRIDPEAQRQIRNGDTGSTLVLAGAS